MAAAAVRAVSEKAGLAVRLGQWLGATNYVRDGWPEHVDYFAAEAVPPGDLRWLPVERAVDLQWLPVERAADLLWLPVGRAADALSRPDDVRILGEFRRRVTARTGCFILRRRAAYSARAVLSAYGVFEEPCADLECALRIAGESFESGSPAAVCADLPAIRELFCELCRRRLAPAPLDATVPEGGLLVVHGTAERIVAVERHLL